MIVVSFGWKGGSSSEVTLSGFRDGYSNPTESKRHLVNASTDIKGTQTWIVFFLEAHSTFDILIAIILLQFVLLDASLENAKPHYHGLLRRY